MKVYLVRYLNGPEEEIIDEQIYLTFDKAKESLLQHCWGLFIDLENPNYMEEMEEWEDMKEQAENGYVLYGGDIIEKDLRD